MRFHLFEFEDLPWFPQTLRNGMVDYLRFVLEGLNFYKPVAPLLKEALEKSGETRILDLCSGGGGAITQVQRELENLMSKPVPVTLSDNYPNLPAFRRIREASKGRIDFAESPVDAADVPSQLQGMRTIFSAIHHFRPVAARAVLRNAVQNGRPIAIFDGGDRNLLTILAILILHPVLFFFCTPLFRPFRWSRLLFTYLIPLIPLCTIWDGLVSVLRMYRPAKLLEIANEAGPAWQWESGKLKHRMGLKVVYLVGYASVGG